jgi:CheY-like chemotaxis protein
MQRMANILIVDDDEQYPVLLAKILRQNNYNVVIATSNGKEALRACELIKFDLIITDIYMPDMDGFELIMNLTNKGSKIPVIAISGGSRLYPRESTLSGAIALGAKAVLAKPFTNEQLFDAIDAAVNYQPLNAKAF